MAARGWAGGAEGWLPAGWPAGQFTSHNDEARVCWRRLFLGRNPRRTFRRMLAWSTTALLLFHYLLIPIKVTGASMTPTYRDGSLNLLNRLSYAKRTPKRGDVVVLRDGDELLLKRVIGLPGENVTLERGVFYINDQPLSDRFSEIPVNWDAESVTLGPNEYFVIGDNRAYSIFGKFERKQILGKTLF